MQYALELLNNLPDTANPVVSIFSGGLDSTILTYALVEKYGKDNVVALVYNYNQKHKIELDKAMTTIQKLGIKHKLLDISFLGDINKDFSSLAGDVEKNNNSSTPSTYIANRNSILINIAVSFAETIGSNNVFYGAQSHDEAGYWDCSLDFVNSLNNTFILNRDHKVKVLAPFMNYWKKDEIIMGSELKVPFSDTWTCYNPQGDKPCGECGSCIERSKAFKEAGVKDE